MTALHGAASVINRPETYVSRGETTIEVPRSRASSRMALVGRAPLESTTSAAPCSMARR